MTARIPTPRALTPRTSAPPSLRCAAAAVARSAAPALAVLLAAVVLAGCGGGGDAAEPTAEPEVRSARVRTEMPVSRDVDDVVTLSADLEPQRRAVLASEVAGTVERMPVDEGDRVATGDLVAAVDTRALEQRAAEAEALYRQAEADYARADALYEKRSITKQQVLDALTTRDVAEARLATARLDLEKSRIRAPWGGRIAQKRVEVGDYTVPGQPVVELVQVNPLKVVAPAPASDVPYLEEGRPVTIRVDAVPGEAFQGRIVRLGAELDPASRTLGVEAEIPNPDGRLRPGMLARMEVSRQTLEGAVLVPLEAVVDLGERRALFVVVDGKARRRIVELGPVIGERVVVLSGLEPGEPVIVEGEQRVADGQPVEVAE